MNIEDKIKFFSKKSFVGWNEISTLHPISRENFHKCFLVAKNFLIQQGILASTSLSHFFQSSIRRHKKIKKKKRQEFTSRFRHFVIFLLERFEAIRRIFQLIFSLIHRTTLNLQHERHNSLGSDSFHCCITIRCASHSYRSGK
jgi:hypothetical protein